MTELTDLSETDASNTLITSINIDEGCAPSGINNAIRNTLGLIRRAFKSSIFRLRDSTDQTKLLAFDLSFLSSSFTRTLAVTDASGKIVTTGDQTASFSTAEKRQILDNSGAVWESIYSGSFTAQSLVDVVGVVGSCRLLKVSGSIVVSTAAGFGLRFSTDGGATFRAGGTDYTRNETHWNAGVVASTVANADRIFLNVAENINASFAFTFDLIIDNVAGTLVTVIGGSAFRGSTSGDLIATKYMAQMTVVTGQIGAIRFASNTGTITGKITVEGAR